MKPIIILSTVLLASTLLGCGGASATNAPATPTANNATATPVADTASKIQTISNPELQKLLDQNVTLVDIRRPEEWKETGVVKGSQLLTLFNANGQMMPDFMTRIKQIAPPNKPVALICRTGNRTQAGAQLLSQNGYSQVYNVQRGITGWIGEGRSVVAAP